jgi:hypothetical protein
MSSVWLVLAHDDEAQIMSAPSLAGPWTPEHRLHKPARHLPRGAHLDPKQSVFADDLDVAARAGSADRGDERLAASLVALLTDASAAAAFDRLVLAIPAHALGVVRRDLPAPISARIVATIDGARVHDDPAAVVAAAGLT